MGNKTEFETRNGHKWVTRRDKKHNFSTKKQEKQGKNREKNGGKYAKEQEKTEHDKKYRNKTRQDIG